MRHQILATAVAFAIASPALATADHSEDAPCPEFIRGSRLQLADTAGGSQLTITTPSREHLPVLRLALREAARFIERRSREAAASDPDRTEVEIPVVSITTRDIEAGVVLTIRARRTGDVSLLRRQSRMIEVLWKRSSCINPAKQLPPGTVSA